MHQKLCFGATMISKLLLLSVCINLAIGLVKKSNETVWSYLGEEGPAYWPSHYKLCNAKAQSPIDIVPEKTEYHPDLTAPVFWHPHGGPINHTGHYYAINNGHTVMMEFEESTKGSFSVNGSGLEGMYKTSQLHFHWGSDNDIGSEHKINSKSYPLEMHIVNFDEKFSGTLKAAKNSSTGLAVFGVMFEISEEDNPLLIRLMDTLHKIHMPDYHHKEEVEMFVLRDLLPKDLSKYYRYQGSLTTPHCYESVIWTVFQEINTLSKFQLRTFRGLLTRGHADIKNSHVYNIPLEDNFRPVQPLNGRKVYRSFKDVPKMVVKNEPRPAESTEGQLGPNTGCTCNANMPFIVFAAISFILMQMVKL